MSMAVGISRTIYDVIILEVICKNKSKPIGEGGRAPQSNRESVRASRPLPRPIYPW